MITLAEGRAFLKALSKLSKWGLVPFDVDVPKGRLTKPTGGKLIKWYLSQVFRAIYLAQTFYQLRRVYWTEEEPHRATALHVGFAFAVPIIFILEIYLTLFVPRLFILVFNHIFAEATAADQHKRRWDRMHIDDLIVRYLVPALSVLTPIVALITIIIIPKYIMRPIDLPFETDYNEYFAVNVLCLVLDVYYYSCVIIQLHVEVFILLITCSKIVKDLTDARESDRYQGIAKERRILQKARKTQLYTSLSNQINSWIVYSIKLVSLSCTISFLYIVITQFSVNVGFSLVFIYASFLTTTCYGYICYFANPVASNMQDLRFHLTAKASAAVVPEYRSELVASIKALKVEPVRFAGFHALEQESFLIYIDFVVNQLVSLLVVHNTEG